MGVAGGDGVGGNCAIRESTYLGGEPSTLLRFKNLPLLLKCLLIPQAESSSFSSLILYLST